MIDQEINKEVTVHKENKDTTQSIQESTHVQDDMTNLRRSQKERKFVISTDYVVYFIGTKL